MSSAIEPLLAAADGVIRISPPGRDAWAGWQAALRSASPSDREALSESLAGESLLIEVSEAFEADEHVGLDAILALHEAAVLAWLLDDEPRMLRWLEELTDLSRLAPAGWELATSVAGRISQRSDLPVPARTCWGRVATAFARASLTARPAEHVAASTLEERVLSDLETVIESPSAWSLAQELLKRSRARGVWTTQAVAWLGAFHQPVAKAVLFAESPTRRPEVYSAPKPASPEWLVYLVSEGEPAGQAITQIVSRPSRRVWEFTPPDGDVVCVVVLDAGSVAADQDLSSLLQDESLEAVAAVVGTNPARRQ